MAEDEDKDENENEGEDERLRKVGKASRWRKEDRKTVKSVDGEGGKTEREEVGGREQSERGRVVRRWEKAERERGRRRGVGRQVEVEVTERKGDGGGGGGGGRWWWRWSGEGEIPVWKRRAVVSRPRGK